MGGCLSSKHRTAPEHSGSGDGKTRSEQSTNREVELQLRIARLNERQVHKVLLLGAGESGKSTIFKQMVSLYGKGFREEERAGYAPVVYDNVLTSMRTLVLGAERSEERDPRCRISDEAMPSRLRLLEEKDMFEEVDEELGQHLQVLWRDEGIQHTFKLRSRLGLQVPDCADYFFERIDVLSRADYHPSEQDVIRSRARTTGIVEGEFLVDSNIFRVVDVGGQRNERKKWIHCFDGVAAVLFVAALSAYDQVLLEDDATRRLDEALDLFSEIASSRWFASSAMILFLNKSDLFEGKLSISPLSDYLPAYTGPNQFQECVEYVHSLFEARNTTGRPVYAHVTCATNQSNIDLVFSAVKGIVIRRGLADAGLI